MEKCLFIKNRSGVLSISVSDRMYNEMTQYMELPEKEAREADMEEIERINEKFPVIDVKREQDSFFVKDGDYFRRVYFNEIRWVEASGSYSCLYLVDTPKLVLSLNLKVLSLHLPPERFFRVHRSYIVNMSYIDSLIGNMLCIGDARIPVSKQHKQDVLVKLNVLGDVK